MSCGVHVARGHIACTKMFTMVSFVFYKGSVVKKKETEQKISFTGGVGSCLTPGKDRSVTLKKGEGGLVPFHSALSDLYRSFCLWVSSKCSQGKGDAGRVLWREGERHPPPP